MANGDPCLRRNSVLRERPEVLGDLPGQRSWARAFGVSVARGSALQFDARLGFQGAQIVPLSCSGFGFGRAVLGFCVWFWYFGMGPFCYP